MSNLLHNYDFSQLLRDSIAQAQSQRSGPRRARGAFRIQRIVRIEKQADRMSWYEVLSCGHAGRRAEGPELEFIGNGFNAERRRCYECCAPKAQSAK